MRILWCVVALFISTACSAEEEEDLSDRELRELIEVFLIESDPNAVPRTDWYVEFILGEAQHINDGGIYRIIEQAVELDLITVRFGTEELHGQHRRTVTLIGWDGSNPFISHSISHDRVTTVRIQLLTMSAGEIIARQERNEENCTLAVAYEWQLEPPIDELSQLALTIVRYMPRGNAVCLVQENDQWRVTDFVEW